VQPLQGKERLNNEREVRTFLPHPTPHCLRKDASASVQLYLEVQLDLIRSGSVEGSSAKLSGLLR